MNRIITYVNDVISRCSSCTQRNLCNWFNTAAESVVLDNTTPEQYAAMTYEEIAFQVHKDAGQPLCNEQQTFDQMMDQVEELLEYSNFPTVSFDLTELLNKMARLEKRLKRIPSACRDVLDAPVRAMIERTLADLDYYYLSWGIDIYPLIQNIHSDYHRTQMLHQNYVEGVVNVLLSKASKLTVDQIVSYEGDFRHYTPPAPVYPLPPKPEIPDDLPFPIEEAGDVQELLPAIPLPEDEPAPEQPEKKGPPKFHLDIPGGTSAVKEAILRFSGWNGKDPITSLLIRAGYKDYVFGDMWDIEHTTEDEWARNHSEDWHRYQFSRWEELRAEVSAEIKKRIHDDLELKKYVCGLLTPFDRFSYYDRIETDIKEMIEAQDVIINYSEQPILTVDEFVPYWKRAVEKARAADAEKNFSIEDFSKELSKCLNEEMHDLIAYDENEEAKAYYDHSMFPCFYAGVIAGCLLENGARLEYMDYQDMCGVNLVTAISAWEICHAMGWTEELVYSYNPRRVEESLYLARAKEENELAVSTADSTVKVSFGNITELSPEFQSRKAAEIWEKAYKAGLIDEHFRFKGTQQDKALFGGDLSMALFGKIDWIAIGKWDNYRYFAQKYGIMSAKSRSELSKNGKLIYDLFA